MRRPIRLAGLLSMLGSVALIATGFGSVARGDTTPTTVAKNVMAPRRDGIRLATDVYRPTAPGTYPVILTRTPYDKTGASDDGTFWAQNGYVYIVQDTRGRYASEGNFDIYVHEDT